MTLEQEIEKAWSEAVSIGAYNEPEDPVLLGEREASGEKFYLYKDKDGRYYYQSDGTLRFEAEMQKKRQKKKH